MQTDEIQKKKIECYLQKMLSLYKALEKFDRVLLLDDSCLVSHTAPDIFEQVPRNQIGAFPESERADFRSYNYDKKFILKKKKININEYYNTGVLLVSKHQREIFSPRNLSKNLELFKSKYPDQAYFSYISAIEKTNVNKLHDEWNFMPVFDYSNDSNRQLTELPNDHLRLVRQKHIIHVTGYYKKRDKIIEQINLALYNDQNVRNSLRPRWHHQ